MKKVMLLAYGEFFEILCRELSKTYKVFLCSDPTRAEEILRMKPDALLLNMLLPGMDTLEFLKRNAKNLPPVVMATTPYISITLLNELSALNADYLIRLPCTMEILLERLAAQLAKKCLS